MNHRGSVVAGFQVGDRANYQSSLEHHAPRAPNRPPALTAEPSLVLCFSHGGLGKTQRRRIPAEGLLLGRDALVFDAPFRDPKLAPRTPRFASSPVVVRWSVTSGAPRGRGSMA